MAEWDAIVVGAGIVGSWAAFHLASQGKKTLLLDQFPLPHTRGSSNGPTRMIRAFYEEKEYMNLVADSYAWWTKLEKMSNTRVFDNTGVLAMQAPPFSYLKACSETMKKNNVKHWWMDQVQLSSKYPMFKYGQDYKAIMDPGAGVLYSNKCMQLVQELFRKSGGVIRDAVKVTGVKEVGNVVEVSSKYDTFRGKKVVLCPGPWAKELLSATGLNLPLVTMPGRQAYFKVKDESMHDIRNGIPIVIEEMNVPEGYQFIIVKPMNEFPGMVKVATRGQPLIKEAHPDERDKNMEPEVYDAITQYVKRHLPYVDPVPCITENCVYTMTPDAGYIVDKHPTMSKVFVGAGFSGHGFKTAPVTGKLLAEMALEQPLSHEVSKWRINRFQKSKL